MVDDGAKIIIELQAKVCKVSLKEKEVVVGRGRIAINVIELACMSMFFFFQAEDGIRDYKVTGVQTCALPISPLVLGLVIAPIFELSLRQSLVMSNGDWSIFFRRPISATLLAICAGLLAVSAIDRKSVV